MILEARGLTLRFGGVEALAAVNTSVAEGEILAVIGPNGAGKTALLNCLSGIYRPQEGEITLDGESLKGLRPDQIARRGIGRSFQHLELFDRLTVLENLMVARYGKTSAGVLRSAIFAGPGRREELEQRRKVEEILDFFELWRYRHAPSAGLPFGVQKLVGVARAIATEPRILLLDEPASGLTRDEKEDLARFLLRLRNDRGVAMVWIEHDIEMVLDLADRLQVLDFGHTIAEGMPDAVKEDPVVIAAYLGERTERRDRGNRSRPATP